MAGMGEGMYIAVVADAKSSRLSAGGRAIRVSLAALLLVAFVVAFLAAHGRTWPWTGFSGEMTLWNWLTMLVQPAAFAFLLARLLSEGRPWRYGRSLILTAAAALVLLTVAGYSLRWAWTGFPGEHFWDWLHLMLFPLVLVLLPEWIRRGEPIETWHWAFGGVGAALFVVTMIGGYKLGWTWTGFTGNTFRDWLNLLIAPFLLPVIAKVVYAQQKARRSAAKPASLPEISPPHEISPPQDDNAAPAGPDLTW